MNFAPVSLDQMLELRLCDDIAKNIDTADDIAARYGMDGRDGLKAYLRAHPKLVTYANKLKALNDSAMGSEDRARLKAVYASEALISHIAHIAGDKATNAAVRVDAFKQLNRMAGMDGAGSGAKSERGGGAGSGGNVPFSVTIILPNRPPEQISATIVDGDLVPPPQVDNTAEPAPEFEFVPVEPPQPEPVTQVPGIGRLAEAAFYQGTARPIA